MQSLNKVVIQFSILLSVLMPCFSSAVQERWGGDDPSQRGTSEQWLKKNPLMKKKKAKFLSRRLDKTKGNM